MNFLQNLTVNLKATGPAAVIIAWFISIAALAMFGSGPIATTGMTFLGVAGMFILGTLAART